MTDADIIAQCSAALNFGKDTVTVPCQLPLPGVIIFVHGVNSDGEWYEATEEGLCKGLNTRLARHPRQMCHGGVVGGTLTPATYLNELTDDGFLNPARDAETFITNSPRHSPVIRFRWGYKASDRELQAFGKGIFLNEQNYWGGGPFANGCTALADLWGDGLDPTLFLSISAQHLNPTSGRDVFACPPRHYYAHAADRLARLVGRIREMQPDCPITIVGHSQGTMITLASAFFGETCNGVADNYVIANSPYNLDENSTFDNYAQRKMTNAAGEFGRQTGDARLQTLKNLVKIVATRSAYAQSAARIDARCANPAPVDGSPGYSASSDPHGRHGNVTVYCNPHDQVISGSTVRGIGWLGIGAEAMAKINGTGEPVFMQRVFAQGWAMGKTGQYHYWNDRTAHPDSEDSGYWHPPSPSARYRLKKGLEASDTIAAKFVTLAGAVLLAVPLRIAGLAGAFQISAKPDEDWQIPLNARPLPDSSIDYCPRSRRLGRDNAHFDEGHDAPADHLNPDRPRGENDPFGQFLAQGHHPAGSRESESQLRYEYRAQLRMKAARSRRDREEANKPDDQTTEQWQAWSGEQITTLLKEGLDQNATDHSTIMTHPDNAEKVLAYDVTAGVSKLTGEQWNELRVAADWRLLGSLKEDSPFLAFAEYFDVATLKKKPLDDKENYRAKNMPTRIVDQRTNAPPPPSPPPAPPIERVARPRDFR